MRKPIAQLLAPEAARFDRLAALSWAAPAVVVTVLFASEQYAVGCAMSLFIAVAYLTMAIKNQKRTERLCGLSDKDTGAE